MTKRTTTISRVNGFFSANWSWLLGIGILFIILGAVGLGMLAGVTIVSMVFFGTLLIIAGIANALDAFKYRSWRRILWRVFIAALYIYAGFLIIYDPLLASALITLLLATMFIIMGVTRLITSAVIRGTPGWCWLIFSGLCALILGIIILIQWPLSSLWFIGMLISIEMLVSGWTYIFIALATRRTSV